MPQQMNQEAKVTFNKGLLTEFSELNFPTEASTDELNCALYKAGNRSRRLGLEFEAGNELSTDTFASGQLMSVAGVWQNVGEDPDIQFVVVQISNRLRFYQKNTQALSSEPVTESFASSTIYQVELSNYGWGGGLGPGQHHVSITSINGLLVVVSPGIDAFYIKRDPNTGAFTESEISFKIRDFEYQGTRSALVKFNGVSPRTPEREYDTLNCGWVAPNGDTALTTYDAAKGYWPKLTHTWYSGKDTSGNFSVTEWDKVYQGNSLITNGHYILDLFNQDRETESGITGVESTVINARFNSVTSFAGRVWYSGVDSKVYFTSILEDNDSLGTLYQKNDPTAEDFSDLLDTDGGYINLPDASGINYLHTFGSSLLVFASNGVWRIQGVDGVFRATEYSVYRITDDGLAQRRSFVSGQNGIPFWWSYTGIHTVQVTDEGGMVEVNLSRDTIQTFWNDIDGSSKAMVQTAYDALNDRILWMYPNEGETTEYKLNRLLFFDATLGAFYPWTIEDRTGTTEYITGAVWFNSQGTDDITFDVVDDNGDQVQDASGNDVVVTISAGDIGSSDLLFFTWDVTGSITFSTFTGTDFLDWGTANYTSFAESSYNFIGDLGRRKNSPYITVFCRVTETGFVLNSGLYDFVREGSILVSTFWDFRRVASSTAQQGYRFKVPVIVDTGDLNNFNSQTTVLATRLRTRGRGRVMKIRFESEQGKDFNLLGWETLNARNSTY